MTDEAAFVQLSYEELARLGSSDRCCSPAEIYRDDELAALPPEVLRLSSGCGHPVEGADIAAGETVLDVGAGAGADCFLAARLTGETGRVVGVDPSPAMRALAERHRDREGLHWVSFLAGDAAALPVPDGTADVVISNCVLSMATDATAAWREIARVTRPGGRFVVSDIIGGDPAAGVTAKARCETGLSWRDYRAVLRGRGFHALRVLRAGPATFRDGHRAQSVTVAGRLAAGEVHAVVLHGPAAAAAAAGLLARVEEACRAAGVRCAGHRLSWDTAWGRRLLELFGGTTSTGPVLALDGAIVGAARRADPAGAGSALEEAIRKAIHR